MRFADDFDLAIKPLLSAVSDLGWREVEAFGDQFVPPESLPPS